jgi:hypothetical protein
MKQLFFEAHRKTPNVIEAKNACNCALSELVFATSCLKKDKEKVFFVLDKEQGKSVSCG